MGSVDRWKTGYRARWRSPDRKSRSKVFARKFDATAFLATVEHTKQTGNYVDPAAGRVPFRQYAEEWRLAQPHRHGTGVAVEQHLRLHVYPIIGAQPIAALADAAPKRYRAIILAGAGLGLRPGELFGLTVDRVEFLKRRVRVEQQLVRARALAWSLAR